MQVYFHKLTQFSITASKVKLDFIIRKIIYELTCELSNKFTLLEIINLEEMFQSTRNDDHFLSIKQDRQENIEI